MQNSSLVPDSSNGAQPQDRSTQGLTLPRLQGKSSVICLTEHELDIAQDLVELFKDARKQGEDHSLSASTVERVEYLFDVAVTLFGAGASPRLVAEALVHPVVAHEGVAASPEERRALIGGYLARRFNERPFLAAENRLSEVPVGSITYDSPTPPRDVPCNWHEIKREVLTPILEKVRAAPDFCPTYTDDQISLIREGFRESLHQVLSLSVPQQSDRTPSDVAWNILYSRIEMALLLLFTKKSPDVVVAGLLHDFRETTSPDNWMETRRRLDDRFGPRVGELVELIGIRPDAQCFGDSSERMAFQEPLLLGQSKNCYADLRTDLEGLIATKVSTLLAREMMESLALARQVSIPVPGIADVFVTGLEDWAQLKWTERISVFASYCDCVYGDKHFRPIFDRTIRAWAKAPKFLSGTIALMTARKAFEELFPRTHESALARLDSMRLVHQVMRTALGAEGQEKAAANLLLSYQKHSGNAGKVKSALHGMDRFEEGLFAEKSRTPQIVMNIKRVEYTESERELIVRAVDFIAEFFCRENLRNMPRNPVDQMKHACEVGFLLMRAGLPADVTIAGLLHDVYELAPKDKVDETRERVLSLFPGLGERIDALIDIVTEPPKDPLVPRENYIIRKSKILHKLEALKAINPLLAHDAATIVCVSKMSTMRDGYHFASDFAKVQPWTKGSWSENVRAMCGLHDMFERLKIRPQVLGAYREELRGWIDVTRYMHPALVDDIRPALILNWEERADQLEESVKTLLQTVQRFHRSVIKQKGNDIRLLVSQACGIVADLPHYAIPVDSQNASIGEFVTCLHEVGRLVFLPRGMYVFSRIAGDVCEIVSGVVADRQSCSYSYLGEEIPVYDIGFQHGLNNLTDVSATIDGKIFIDRALSALHGRRIVEKVDFQARRGDRSAIRLIEALIHHQISPARFERIQGYDRHLFQQLASAEDSRYLGLIAGPEDVRFNDFRYSMALVKGGELASTIDRLGSEDGVGILRQYSVVLGGLKKQLEFYISRGELVDAEVCFLTAYFNFQDSVGKQSSSPWDFLLTGPAQLFLRKADKMVNPAILDGGMRSSRNWEVEIHKVVNGVREMYDTDFFTELERIEKIRLFDHTLGRPRQLPELP
jgi:predicted HD phosphohydrolase